MTKPIPEALERTYLEPMGFEETEMLYRMVCLGLNSGDPKVRGILYAKVQKGYENAKLGRAWVCTRDNIEGQKAGRGKAKERV